MQNYCFSVPRLVHVTPLLFLWLSTGKVSFKTTAFLYPDWYTSHLSCSFGSLKTKPVSKLLLLCTQTGTPNTALVPLVLLSTKSISKLPLFCTQTDARLAALVPLFIWLSTGKVSFKTAASLYPDWYTSRISCSFGSLQAKLVSKLLLICTQTGTHHASLVHLALYMQS